MTDYHPSPAALRWLADRLEQGLIPDTVLPSISSGGIDLLILGRTNLAGVRRLTATIDPGMNYVRSTSEDTFTHAYAQFDRDEPIDGTAIHINIALSDYQETRA